MRGFNLDQLQAFAEVIELGSFSAAAERLNLSQPAVSLQVRELERRLGVRLIERVGRKASPTAAGAELLIHSRRIAATVAAAVEAVTQHAQGVIGRVRLGTGATACIYVLPPILRQLHQRFPALEIVVTTGSTAEILKMVDDNSLDLGLVTLPASGRMFEITTLLEDEFVAIAPVDTPDMPNLVTPAMLAAHRVVLYEPGANTRRIVDEWFHAAGIALKPVMELGNVEAIKEIVGAGLGWGVLPRMAVPDDAGPGSVVVRSLSPKLYRKLGIVLRRDKPLSRALKETVEALASLSTS